jgi:hypothetical protein
MMVVLTLVLPVLLGAVGLGADIGILYLNWAQIQKAADAAALAAAQHLTGSTATTDNTAVENVGQQYAQLNGVSGADTINVAPAADEKSVTVTVSRTVPYYFLKLVGVQSGLVTARALAGIVPSSVSCGVMPIGLPCAQTSYGPTPGQGDNTCGGAYDLYQSIGLDSDWTLSTGVPGNWELLQIGGPGGKTIEQNIANPSTDVGVTPGQWLSTKPGGTVGDVVNGMNARMDGQSLLPAPQQGQSIPTPSPQIILVPLVDYTQATKNGQSTVPVLGFVTMWVTNIRQGGNGPVLTATVIPPVPGCGLAPTPGQTPNNGLYQAILCPDSGCPVFPSSAWPT